MLLKRRMKKCSPSSAIRETQIQCDEIASDSRMAVIKLWEHLGHGALPHCWWEDKLVEPKWKPVEVPQKLQTELSV